MSVKLEWLELSGFDGWRRRKFDIEERELINLGAQAIQAAEPGTSGVPIDITNQVFEAAFGQAGANQRPYCILAERVGDNWLTVHWDCNCFDDGGHPYSSSGFLFGWRGAAEDNFFQIVSGKNYSINPRTGDITITRKGQQFFFPTGFHPWPYPLLPSGQIPENMALGMLNALLQPSDENPITALVGAGHQPCRYASKQVIGRLKAIQQLLQKEGEA